MGRWCGVETFPQNWLKVVLLNEITHNERGCIVVSASPIAQDNLLMGHRRRSNTVHGPLPSSGVNRK